MLSADVVSGVRDYKEFAAWKLSDELRSDPKDHARFLRMSRGSHSEIQEHLRAAVQRERLTEKDTERARTLARRAGGACTGLIRYLESAKAPGRD